MDLDAVKAQLRLDEGLKLKPYEDGRGKITIGYGRNLTDVGISLPEAEEMLTADVALVASALPLRWAAFRTLDEVRQGVLVNMAYNLGIAGLMLFTHMLHACATGDFETAANEMENTPWAAQIGPRAHRLANLMRHGA